MTSEIISTILLNCFPFTIALAIWFYQWIIQRMPEKQRRALDYFAHLAVQRTEQLLSTASSDDKKTIALRLIRDLFRSFNLPVPSDLVLDAAIEAVVYEINGATGKAQRDHNDPDPFAPPPSPLRVVE